jgi:hypothetical protein
MRLDASGGTPLTPGGLYLVARALVEPFVIDMTDPGTYRDDWGGPSLAGVLLVHCGPGLLVAAWAVMTVRSRSRRKGGGGGR